MQHLAANKQVMRLLQRITSQLTIKTAQDTKNSLDDGGINAGNGVGGGTSFRRQRGVRAKRGESIKKTKPNHSYESSDRSPWLKQRYPSINTSDLSSEESGDNGRYSISSETCSSRNSSKDKSKDFAVKGVWTVIEGWIGGKVNWTNKWMTEAYDNYKISDEEMVNTKAANHKVVIFIDKEGKHLI